MLCWATQGSPPHLLKFYSFHSHLEPSSSWSLPGHHEPFLFLCPHSTSLFSAGHGPASSRSCLEMQKLKLHSDYQWEAVFYQENQGNCIHIYVWEILLSASWLIPLWLPLCFSSIACFIALNCLIFRWITPYVNIFIVLQLFQSKFRVN